MTLHNFSLIINCLCMKCMLKLLNDNIADFSAVKTAPGTYKSFKLQRQVVLTTSSQFIAYIQNLAVGCGMCLNFWRSDQTNFFNRIFDEIGLTGKLEAPDYDSINIV